MDDKSSGFCSIFRAELQSFQESLTGPVPEFLWIFPSREGQGCIAVHPRLILGISGHFLPVFVFESSEITFSQVLNHLLLLARIDTGRCLTTAKQGTYKKSFCFRIVLFFQLFLILFQNRFIGDPDIAIQLIPGCFPMPDQIYSHLFSPFLT